MFDEQRLGNDGTEASRPCKPDDGDNQMKEKDDDIAPTAMVSKPEQTPNFGQFSNSPWTGTLFLLAMAYRMVDGIAGSYIAARLAPRRPMQHSLILGAVGIVLSSIGAVVTWNKGPAFGPHWFPIALIVIAMPCAWAGGRLRVMQLRARPAT